MNRLYYKEPYLKEFVSVIEEIKEKESKFHIVLDKTAFFPGGGGQWEDRGYIQDKKIVDVYEENGIIYHVLEEKIEENLSEVKCKIDWNRRVDGMQQHLGQHVISGCFFKEFNQNTAGFHMGKDSSTVDIKGDVNKSKIEYIEKIVNEVVHKNLDVIFSIPSKKELENIKLRRNIPITNKEISVVEIKGLDVNACCGIHPKKTLELQLIKILSFKKNKDCTRIEFLAGKRAIDYTLKLAKINKDVCDELTCGEEDLINTINNLKSNNTNLVNDNKRIRNSLNKYIKISLLNKINEIKGISMLSILYIENKIIIDDVEIEYSGDIKDIVAIANDIVSNKNIVILIGGKRSGLSNLVFMKSKEVNNIDISLLFDKAIDVIEGKGGGNKNMFQGSGRGEKIKDAIEVAEKYLNLIINNIKS